MTIIILAYVMDLIFGDPRWLPHPVKIMGDAITKLEITLRKVIWNERLAGIVLAGIIIYLSWLFPFLLIKLAAAIHKYAALAVSVILIYTTLSVKDLKIHAIAVYSALKSENLKSARRKLAMIVGRDTQNLDEKEIIRAAVETTAENTVDGIISPLFFAFIAGAPLAMAYKAVNTLDSMVGYKNKRYKDFGWAAAKMDDLANFVPARISALLIPAASWLLGRGGIRSWQTALRYGRKNPSPNSGISQAAIAGALGIQLGGRCLYNGQIADKPLIGSKINALTPKHIIESIKISYLCGILTLLCAGLLSLLSTFIFSPAQAGELPKRVISLAPSVTESIYALGAQDNLIGVTTYCDYPQDARNKPKIGTLISPNIEKILTLSPDMILTVNGVQRIQTIEKLKSLGLKVIALAEGSNFNDITNNFLYLSEILDKNLKACEIVQTAKKKIKELTTRIPNMQHPRVFWQVNVKPLVTVGKNTFANSIIELSGGINIFNDIIENYPRVNYEEVILRNPQVIILVTMGDVTASQRRFWENFSQIDAVRNGRIYVIDADLVCKPTINRFLAGVETIQNTLYQDIANE